MLVQTYEQTKPFKKFLYKPDKFHEFESKLIVGKKSVDIKQEVSNLRQCVTSSIQRKFCIMLEKCFERGGLTMIEIARFWIRIHKKFLQSSCEQNLEKIRDQEYMLSRQSGIVKLDGTDVMPIELGSNPTEVENDILLVHRPANDP